MDTHSFLERCQAYRAVIEEFLARWENHASVPAPLASLALSSSQQHADRNVRAPLPAPQPHVHFPKLAGLRRPLPGMFYHLAPELFLQQGGATEFTCPADRFTLRGGEAALIPRGLPHGEAARHLRGSRFRGLVFCFHGNEVTLIITRADPDGKPTGALWDTFEGPEAAQAVRYLDDAGAVELDEEQPADKSVCPPLEQADNPARPPHFPAAEAHRRALVCAALCTICGMLAPGRLARRAHLHEHPKVRHCHELIRARLPDPALSVESLARQLGCTPDHLSRCFRAETGLSVLAYVRERRLEHAKMLLQDPRLNVSEIAWACGFGSLNYFVRVFRQAAGQSPGRFQRVMAPRGEP